jgi:hypothetical protein
MRAGARRPASARPRDVDLEHRIKERAGVGGEQAGETRAEPGADDERCSASRGDAGQCAQVLHGGEVIRDRDHGTAGPDELLCDGDVFVSARSGDHAAVMIGGQGWRDRRRRRRAGSERRDDRLGAGGLHVDDRDEVDARRRRQLPGRTHAHRPGTNDRNSHRG